MNHRERAAARLSRSTFGWSEWDGRLPTYRLAARSETPGDVRPAPSDSLTRREVTVKKIATAQVGPHAPLLKRVIRTPYALETTRAARVDGRPIPDLARTVVEPRKGPIDDGRSELGALRAPEAPPMRALDHRPHYRLPPFWRIRMSKGDDR